MSGAEFAGRRYRYLSQELMERYGKRLEKLMLDGGFTCPNRDGTLGWNGCVFCSEGGSGEFAANRTLTVTEQIEMQIREREERGRAAQGYIAYFQAYTGTYAPLARLRHLYFEAAAHPMVEVISIATRPDCLSGEVLALLEEVNRKKPVWIELGLQTMHERTADLIRRGYSLPVFEKAVCELHQRRIPIVVHLIIGLMQEDREMLLETVRYCDTLPVWGVKLQLLHVLKGTELEKWYEEGSCPVLSMEEYTELLADCIGELRPDIVIHRLTGDGDRGLLVAPLWSLQKRRVLNAIHHRLKEKDIWQGKNWKKMEYV